MILKVLSVPAQFLQDVRKFNADAVSCTTKTTQLTNGQIGEDKNAGEITVIPQAPGNVENLKFS
jgi:hypothetical protein